MTPYTKMQIRLQNEMAALANCQASLREIYLENNSPDLLAAMDAILKRMLAAENELDIAIEAQQLDENVPILSLTQKKRLKI